MRALAQETHFDNEPESFMLDGNALGDLSAQVDREQEGVPEAPTWKVRAKFTRTWTHNEQLVVTPCGMILARDTMFGAEGIASVAEFLKRTFRIEMLKPEHIFFDNNCSLVQHVKDDPFFADVGLTVDVFHFKSKHKVTYLLSGALQSYRLPRAHQH
jgi:hypothetical protein